MDTPVHIPSVDSILFEPKRIFRGNYIHFFALSFLFLPLSFSLIINPTFTGDFFTIHHFHNPPQNHPKSITPHLLYILIIYVFTLCAIDTITYSTYHGFSGKPANFSDSLKSLTFSFFPIISTAFLALFLLFIITLVFLLFVGASVMLGQNLGFVNIIDYNLIHYTWFSGVVCVMLIVIILYILVNWSLTFVVVVVESKWGFKALKRSWDLMKGRRLVSLLYMLYIGVVCGCTVLVNSDSVRVMSSEMYALFPMIVGSSMLMWFLLWSTAANTVFYMYCKAFHGELGIKIADGLAKKYFNLPSDDEKVSHVVTVVAT